MNHEAMENQIRKASLALLPGEANATWIRQATGTTNALGEPASGTATATTWSVRVAQLNLVDGRGKWTPAGVQVERGARFIVAGPDGWVPRQGDLLEKGDSQHRVTGLTRQDVASIAYWIVTAEAIRE